MSGVQRRRDQVCPGIGDRRSAGIADERNVTIGKRGQEPPPPFFDIVLVVAHQWRVDPEMGHQSATVPRVFRGNQVHVAQRLNRPWREIA